MSGSAIGPSPLTGVLEHLRGEPSRTWSIVLTLFGDAVVPRGGSIWLGSLLALFEAMGIGGGVVRTAMSRLAADEWLVRSRVGRKSFYALTEKGRSSFAEADRRIYGKLSSDWDGQFRLVIAGREATRDAGRDATSRAVLERAGFGSMSPGVWIAPMRVTVPAGMDAFMLVTIYADKATGRKMAEQAWPLTQTGEAYDRFLAVFGPLNSSTVTSGLSDLDAMVARTLLIHEYRRVNLRDPILPTSLLPDGWPGIAARRLCSEMYQALVPLSERWLDGNGLDERGPLRPPVIDLRARFPNV